MARYDIHFQLVPEAEQPYSAGKVFTFGFTSAVGVRGPQKLVNRWLKCLLTAKGSDPLRPNYGTGYSDLFGSNVSRYQDFLDAVALAVNDCNGQLQAIDRAQFPPDDERLASATIASIVPRGSDGYDVYVYIRNVAGAVLTAQVPSQE